MKTKRLRTCFNLCRIFCSSSSSLLPCLFFCPGLKSSSNWGSIIRSIGTWLQKGAKKFQ